ncbi:velvet factor-domain-containing protein [Fomes fomentarius]|nr:velvet factor-domain-containing protein [Fomes fomentarius]
MTSLQVPLSVGPTALGGPIAFTHGPFAGKVVRVAATELQKADAGRKYARKDRRSLDPPPVVQVRFFEVHGVNAETEISNYDENLASGLICHVDLFPVGDYTECNGANENVRESRGMNHYLCGLSLPALSFAPGNIGDVTHPYSYPWMLQPRCVSTLYQSQASRDNIVAYYGHYPIRESTISTTILAGTLFATAVVVEQNRRRMLTFVFNDLAVRQEGHYSLRYQIFHIHSKTTDDGGETYRTPVLVRCFGGVFRIWSTKTFPGLAPSTTLTKSLSLFGAAVNVRLSVRNRKRRKIHHAKSNSYLDEAESTASSERLNSETLPLEDRRASLPPNSSTANALQRSGC